MNSIVNFVTSEKLKTSITLSLYTQANYANKMKINTIQSKKQKKRTRKVSENEKNIYTKKTKKRTSKVSEKYFCIKQIYFKELFFSPCACILVV